MPPARKAYHHGDLARAIKVEALALLAEVGVEALSLREAARRVGVSHRAVYRHFEDKRALLADLAAEGYAALAVELEAAVRAAADAGSERRLLALAEAYLRFARREPARYVVMFGPRLNEDARFPELERAVRSALVVLTRELERLAPEAPSRARRDGGVAIWAAIHGLASLILARRVPLADRHVHAYVGTVMGPVVAGVAASLRVTPVG